ncbi:MAG: 4Fe-4S binding protein [Lachnospiraceae bacterium]|nr:4Fe-4S binding protein [Lachnospiraceae bacterium]
MNILDRKTAVVHCSGGCLVEAGKRTCDDGCIGCGICVRTCEAGAISLILKSAAPGSTDAKGQPVTERKLAVVNRELCTGCGACAAKCPKHVIEVEPYLNTIQPLCRNTAAGKEARKQCVNSCIACRLCEKNCPADAIHVTDNRAVINQKRCIACGMCASKCPRGVIHDVNGVIAAAFPG